MLFSNGLARQRSTEVYKDRTLIYHCQTLSFLLFWSIKLTLRLNTLMFHFANPVGGNKKRTSALQSTLSKLTYHVNSWITMLERSVMGFEPRKTSLVNSQLNIYPFTICVRIYFFFCPRQIICITPFSNSVI